MYNKKVMDESARVALFGCTHNIGGPFGAAIVRNGEIISVRSNTVLQTNDPTAHAEVNAIRDASLKLNTYDLSNCELYATGYPCPMCLGAIMWSGIKKVYISGMLEDAEKIGFKDKFIYETIDNLKNSCYNKNVLEMEFFDREIAQNLYEKYEKSSGTIY